MADYRFFNTRLQPCYILHENKIPCVIWFEDAIGQYEVPTIVFDVHILVSNIDEAAQALVQRGWTPITPDQGYLENAMAGRARRCLIPPKDDSGKAQNIDPLAQSQQLPGPTKTLLLPAADWNFTLPDHSEQIFDGSRTPFYPSLPELLDALIDSLLDSPTSNFVLRSHLACQVAYLYSYAPAVKQKSFAKYLKYEHRQYHFDSLSGMTTGTTMFISHQRTIREALRRGEYQLRDCSATRDNEYLFNEGVMARLLKKLSPPAA
jgi:hypothetical protein